MSGGGTCSSGSGRSVKPWPRYASVRVPRRHTPGTDSNTALTYHNTRPSSHPPAVRHRSVALAGRVAWLSAGYTELADALLAHGATAGLQTAAIGAPPPRGGINAGCDGPALAA